ncbi:brain-specific homeobox/POU domain protein 3-like [Protopterus annectens]|uniref:brain-specific homeobox/POU domain protein 3-like n=1 Tax=Protopterus annectens TaxID=7888 RepID=UPI001CFA1D76|nr:brain-specific homeobox/POU domain protein 3-like [Protopterus annectens]
MMSINGKHSAFSMLHEPKYAHLHSSSEALRRACLPPSQIQGSIFAGFDESLLRGAETLAALDIVSHSQKAHPFKPDASYHTMSTVSCSPTSSILHHSSVLASHHPHHQPSQGLESDLLDTLTSSISLGGMPAPDIGTPASHPHVHLTTISHLSQHPQTINMPSPHSLASHSVMQSSETEIDPRDLESFAERFKQRRIKLGVTQADVGSALANLKIPGVGCLSQSTICRFESLTLSHNNMVALKPILEAWLEEAERAQQENMSKPQVFIGGDTKRKRTSIAAPEKRSLEAYFSVQPRPSSEKIAAIAEKLDLKKNVVRVWFCNQRQKQKRMKFSAAY